MPFPPAISHPGSQPLDAFSDGNPDSKLLQKQRKKLKEDWERVAEAVPNIPFETYVHCWLLVNTRTLYFEMPNLKPLPHRDDRIVMCPFVDLFNHNDTGYGPTGYIVVSDKAYDAGDEVYVSYGKHTNDFLLVEYGFVLDNNRWDATPIDHCLMPHLLGTPVERQLQQAGYLGNYSLSSDGVCYRTQVATRAQFLSADLWLEFIAGRNLNEIGAEQNAEALITSQVLEPYLREAESALKWLDNPSAALTKFPYGPCQVLIRRWKQIEALLRQTTSGLVADKDGQTADSHKSRPTERY
ncbi:MAG: hypothetical protein Q9213_003906 [Squamulea squamosa]